MINELTGLLLSIQITDVIDIVIVAYILYRLLGMIKETRAQQLFRGVLLIVGVFLASELFGLSLLNWLLTRLHNSRKLFSIVTCITLFILFISPRYLIVVEVMEMMLMAAVIYPNKIPSSDPKGRKGIPTERNKISFKNAA